MSKFIRLNIIAEGQTEERFVKETLSQHLGTYNISTSVRCVLTRKDKARRFKGGLVSYEKAKLDITVWLKTDRNPDARFTTMFDLFALPKDFPGYTEASKAIDPYTKVEILEKALQEDIGDWRFLPYIQLHEFETLLFVKPEMLEMEYFMHTAAIKKLMSVPEKFKNNVELINDNPATAPSKRIIALIPEYEGNKATVGAAIAGQVGVDTLKAHCRHFGEWVNRLEALSDT